MSAEEGIPSRQGEQAANPILAVVVEMLDTQGYEAVQLREVARRARVSLATIYRQYPTRDALIVAALEWWLDINRYADISRIPQRHESLYEGLMALHRALFEPWVKHPEMLRAYFRAQSGPGGERLTEHGFDVVVPAAQQIISHADPGFADDLQLILSGVVYGVLARFADGAIEVTEILPALERAIYWLTAANEAARNGSVRPSPQAP